MFAEASAYGAKGRSPRQPCSGARERLDPSVEWVSCPGVIGRRIPVDLEQYFSSYKFVCTGEAAVSAVIAEIKMPMATEIRSKPPNSGPASAERLDSSKQIYTVCVACENSPRSGV